MPNATIDSSSHQTARTHAQQTSAAAGQGGASQTPAIESRTDGTTDASASGGQASQERQADRLDDDTVRRPAGSASASATGPVDALRPRADSGSPRRQGASQTTPEGQTPRTGSPRGDAAGARRQLASGTSVDAGQAAASQGPGSAAEQPTSGASASGRRPAAAEGAGVAAGAQPAAGVAPANGHSSAAAGGVAAGARPAAGAAEAAGGAAGAQPAASQNAQQPANAQPLPEYAPGRRDAEVEFGRAYRQAVRTARQAICGNPMGRLDDAVFSSSTMRRRQARLPRDATFKRLAYESATLVQDALAWAFYPLNKILGNGRVQRDWLSATNGGLATGEARRVGEQRYETDYAGGVVPKLAGIFTHAGALLGASIGWVAESIAEEGGQTQRYAAFGAKVGALLTCGITQLSVGINFVLKAVVAAQLIPPMMMMLGFFAAVSIANLRFERAFDDFVAEAGTNGASEAQADTQAAPQAARAGTGDASGAQTSAAAAPGAAREGAGNGSGGQAAAAAPEAARQGGSGTRTTPKRGIRKRMRTHDRQTSRALERALANLNRPSLAPAAASKNKAPAAAGRQPANRANAAAAPSAAVGEAQASGAQAQAQLAGRLLEQIVDRAARLALVEAQGRV